MARPNLPVVFSRERHLIVLPVYVLVARPHPMARPVARPNVPVVFSRKRHLIVLPVYVVLAARPHPGQACG